MTHGFFHGGSKQDFCFPEGHELAGYFKGMQKILEGWGYNVTGKKAQCSKSFQDCPEGENNQCCLWRMLYSKPDFQSIPSALEEECNACGFAILFLPKYYCELNFIEQCWGHVKHHYQTFPALSREVVLEKNVIQALDEVPLLVMRRSVNS
jgi:hypothetical protein